MTDAALLDQLVWPDASVCGWDGCPTSMGRYCIDCHIDAWNALAAVRQRLVDGMVSFARSAALAPVALSADSRPPTVALGPEGIEGAAG